MSSIRLVATVDEELKRLIENWVLASFLNYVTCGRLIGDPELEVRIHGKERGGFMLDFSINDGDSEDTIDSRQANELGLFWLA
jgi:hypothetical protein